MHRLIVQILLRSNSLSLDHLVSRAVHCDICKWIIFIHVSGGCISIEVAHAGGAVNAPMERLGIAIVA